MTMPQTPAVLLPTLRRGLVALVVALVPSTIALVACGGAGHRPAGTPAASDASVEVADAAGDGAPPAAAPLSLKETKKKPAPQIMDAGKPAQDAGPPRDGGK